MKETITSFVGLDVHKDSIAIAVAEAGRQAPRFVGTVVPSLPSLNRALRDFGSASRTLVVYEAGPCGYGLARRLNAQGYTCEVVAPAHIARSPIDQRIKTDRRDALLLARESRAGNLVPVVLPDERDEAIRDLSRTREDVLAARLRAHQQMKALLLRHGRTCPGRIAWSPAHERTLGKIRLPYPAQEIAFVEYRNAIKDAHERLERVTEALRLQSNHWRMNPLVRALMCLRGFDFIAAITFVAEIGDPRRTEPATRCAGTMRGTLESFAWAPNAVIPVIRPRQPREEEMKCGSQPADTRVIRRRSHCPARRVARSVGTLISTQPS
jgi:transposase